MKRCSRCKQSKPFSEFGKYSRMADGLDYYCKACRNATHRASTKRVKQRNLNTETKPSPLTARCPKCEQVKSASEFSKSIFRANGLNTYCRSCWSVMRKTK